MIKQNTSTEPCYGQTITYEIPKLGDISLKLLGLPDLPITTSNINVTKTNHNINVIKTTSNINVTKTIH